jgi:CcmD family protein
MDTLKTVITDTLMQTVTPQVKVVGEDIYIVMYVTLIIWLGVFFYLLYMDRKLKQIDKKINNV